jgi:hypothetical protein
VLVCGVALIAAGIAAREQHGTRPPRWVGAEMRDARITVTIADGDAAPRVVATEPDPKRAGYSLAVTDLALDPTRDLVYVATCCEPGSGSVRRVDLRSRSPVLVSDDQGYRVDVAGPAPTVARTDTAGTLAIRRSPGSQQELRELAGVADVAVDASAQVVALVDTARLRALVPTVAARDRALLRLRWTGSRWTEESYPLTGKNTYCDVIALGNDAIGLLAGQISSANPVSCTGNRLDILNLTTRELRSAAIVFPANVRHISVDATFTFLIITTVDGAVRWHTVGGASGSLAARGFVAADW